VEKSQTVQKKVRACILLWTPGIGKKIGVGGGENRMNLRCQLLKTGGDGERSKKKKEGKRKEGFPKAGGNGGKGIQGTANPTQF